MTNAKEKATKAIEKITGKNVVTRRIQALEALGFTVSDVETKWNFGRVGSTKDVSANSFWLQIAYATGGKSSSGYGVNACPCVLVSF